MSKGPVAEITDILLQLVEPFMQRQIIVRLPAVPSAPTKRHDNRDALVTPPFVIDRGHLAQFVVGEDSSIVIDYALIDSDVQSIAAVRDSLAI